MEEEYGNVFNDGKKMGRGFRICVDLSWCLRWICDGPWLTLWTVWTPSSVNTEHFRCAFYRYDLVVTFSNNVFVWCKFLRNYIIRFAHRRDWTMASMLIVREWIIKNLNARAHNSRPKKMNKYDVLDAHCSCSWNPFLWRVWTMQAAMCATHRIYRNVFYNCELMRLSTNFNHLHSNGEMHMDSWGFHRSLGIEIISFYSILRQAINGFAGIC